MGPPGGGPYWGKGAAMTRAVGALGGAVAVDGVKGAAATAPAGTADGAAAAAVVAVVEVGCKDRAKRERALELGILI